MQKIDLYLHHSRLNSRFFLKVGLSYLFLAIIAFLATATFISITNLHFGELYSYSTNESEDDYDDTGSSIVEVTIEKSDTIERLLRKQPISDIERREIVSLIKGNKADRTLKQGKKMLFEYDTRLNNEEDEELIKENCLLRQITYYYSPTKKIEIIRKDDDTFSIKDQTIPLKKLLVKYSAPIKNSLLDTAKALNVPKSNIIELVNIYSNQIDFKRQIKEGDEISIIAEKFYNGNGDFSHNGKIIFASIQVSGKKFNIYRYSPNNDTKFQYFSENAQSMKSNLLINPIKHARLTSRFGMRRDPIDGYTKMHKGIDFAAPMGTPIFAAGDGRIVDIGWKGGYGKYMKIKHNDSISTAYAHVMRFAQQLKHGSFVKQGQVIAYVGHTGKSTAPHLHYEILVNNHHVNPTTIKTTPQVRLAGKKLERFEALKKQLEELSDTLNNKTLTYKSGRITEGGHKNVNS